LNQLVRLWGEDHGFSLFPRAGFGSITLNCFANAREIDLVALNTKLKPRGFVIDGGYGKLKGKAFRISNMGDETEASMKELLAALDATLAELIS
ncbi:MAG: alanine--glyoxylate aminotransferase family protein, partial [Candidatus Didemnitutus sp.]|nr:alanine--glyoxylate aminotransferase family protein [Candidatus Didemnitutus sp.]